MTNFQFHNMYWTYSCMLYTIPKEYIYQFMLPIPSEHLTFLYSTPFSLSYEYLLMCLWNAFLFFLSSFWVLLTGSDLYQRIMSLWLFIEGIFGSDNFPLKKTVDHHSFHRVKSGKKLASVISLSAILLIQGMFFGTFLETCFWTWFLKQL